MSLYTMFNGVKPAVFFILPMLGKHADRYPRFRDCFTGDEERPDLNDHIHVYTRTGGDNREDYKDEIAEMQGEATYVTDYDDASDGTYATFVFSVPERWAADFIAYQKYGWAGFSAEYWDEIRRVYPKLNEKFNEMQGLGIPPKK